MQSSKATRVRRLPNALTSWKRLAKPLRFPRTVLLLLDFDGTLADIAPTPEQARLRPRVLTLLRELARMPRLRVGFVSGRALGDLKKKIPLRKAVFVGSHGLELQTAAGRESAVSPAMRKTIARAKHRVRTRLGREPGAHLEYKPFSVGVHYRQATPAQTRLIRGKMLELGEEFSPKMLVQSGKRILELLPALSISKGTGVKRLLRDSGFKGGYPLYLGDDVTDETVFRALGKKGLTIFVGPARNRSAARYQLDSPREVEQFLQKLKELRI
ncbi:MAG: trehalose-phosphatase [Acidobacteriota bacterium]